MELILSVPQDGFNYDIYLKNGNYDIFEDGIYFETMPKLTQMLLKCIDIDMNNLGENGLNCFYDVYCFYQSKSDLEILKIYIEYFGLF